MIFFVNMGGSIVLARLLEPEDFGVFGIVLIFVGLATRCGNVGFGLALVQREKIEDAHISSLFVVNFCLFSIIAVVLVWVSPLIGTYFDSPLSGEVLGVLSVVFLLKPFSSVPRALLQRKMEFKVQTFAQTSRNILWVFSAIGLALNGFGVWSLAYSEIIAEFFWVTIMIFYARWRPSFLYKHSAMKDLFSFGSAIFINRLVVYGSDKVDIVFIGKQLGVGPLGLYEKAYGLMNMTIRELGNLMEPILFRAFSIIQNDPGRILAGYKKVLLTFSLISYPIFFGLSCIAPSFIYVVYGEKWMASVIPLQIMCFSGIFRLQLKVMTIVMNAMGKVKIETGLRFVALILLIIGCGIGSIWGINGVASATTIVSGILSLGVTIYFSQLTHLRIFHLMRPQATPLVAAVFMYVMVLFVQNLIFGIEAHSLLALMVLVIVGALTYVGTLLILRPPAVMALIHEMGEDFKPFLKKFKQVSL